MLDLWGPAGQSHRTPMVSADEDSGRLYGLAVRVSACAGASAEGSACPVCRGRRGRPRFEVDSLDALVSVCEGCGLGRLDPMPDREAIAAWYPDSYYGAPGRKFAFLVEQGVRWVARRQVGFLTRRLVPGDRVLDVGCGRGVLLGPMADRGLAAHGVEMSEEATRGADPRVEIRVAPCLADARYPAGFFRQVVIWHVLEHLPDPRETLVEVHRVLEAGGEVVVAVPNFSSLQARWSGASWFHLDLPRHLHHFPLEAMRQLLSDVGFEVTSEHHFSLRQNPFGWIQSLQNRWEGVPRNGIYRLLHSKSRGERPPFTPAVRARLYAWLVLSAPFALGLSVCAALLRSGATVHVVATRRA